MELRQDAGSNPATSTFVFKGHRKKEEKMNENLVLAAIRAKLEATRLDGLATLNVYVTNPAGIGEHPQIVEEALNALKKIDAAESALETLANIVNSSPPPEEESK